MYGDTGIGKTSLAVHLVENKGLAITGDSAWSVIEKYPAIMPKWERVPFDGLNQVRKIAELHIAGHPRIREFDTLLWDPTSVGVNVMLRRAAIKNRVEVEGWPEYRYVERAMMDTVELLNKTDMNIIYTAHIRFPSEADAKRQLLAIRPNMPEACYNLIARECNAIGYMYREKRGAKRRIQFEGTTTVTAKSQIAGIEEDTYDVDEVPTLVSAWRGGQL